MLESFFLVSYLVARYFLFWQLFDWHMYYWLLTLAIFDVYVVHPVALPKLLEGGDRVVVPWYQRGWYLEPNSGKTMEPGTKSSGTGTQPIGVGTNKKFCQLMFLEFLEQLLTATTKFQLSGSGEPCTCVVVLRVQSCCCCIYYNNNHSMECDWMKL